MIRSTPKSVVMTQQSLTLSIFLVFCNNKNSLFLLSALSQAQLLILEGRYGDAEVLLEALTRLDDEKEVVEEKSNEYLNWSASSSSSPELESKSSAFFNHHRKEARTDAVAEDSPVQQQSSSSSATSLLLIDVHHQLALLYTLTNRSADVGKVLIYFLLVNQENKFKFTLFFHLSPQALDSISRALAFCSGKRPASSSVNTFSSTAAIKNQSFSTSILSVSPADARCAQIYTLQGDIRKDLQQWAGAIQVN